MREHITDGNAATVHAARAVTADTSHAVLREKTTRAALYVATTHGRGSNNAYLYGREAEASEYSDTVPTGSTCCAQLSGKRSAPMRAHNRIRTRRRNRSRTPANACGCAAYRPPHPLCAGAASGLPPVVLKAPAAVGRSPTEHRPTPTPIA